MRHVAVIGMVGYAGLDGQTVRALIFRKNGNRVGGGRCMLWVRSIDVISELLQWAVDQWP